VASSLAQTSYLNSDTCRIVQTHKDRWSSYVSKLQLSFYTCWSQCIIASQSFSYCAVKFGIAYAVLLKHVPCGTVRKSATQQRRPCVEMPRSKDKSTFIGTGTHLDWTWILHNMHCACRNMQRSIHWGEKHPTCEEASMLGLWGSWKDMS